MPHRSAEILPRRAVLLTGGGALLAAALALAGDDAAARAAMALFRRAEPYTPLDALAQRCAAPFEATDPLYKERNKRVLDGLRRADALAP